MQLKKPITIVIAIILGIYVFNIIFDDTTSPATTGNNIVQVNRSAEIVNLDSEKSSRGSLTTIYITVKNTGNVSLNYIRYNIYYYDAYDNLIDTDWSNSSVIIAVNETVVISTTEIFPDNCTKYRIKITDLN